MPEYPTSSPRLSLFAQRSKRRRTVLATPDMTINHCDELWFALHLICIQVRLWAHDRCVAGEGRWEEGEGQKDIIKGHYSLDELETAWMGEKR